MFEELSPFQALIAMIDFIRPWRALLDTAGYRASLTLRRMQAPALLTHAIAWCSTTVKVVIQPILRGACLVEEQAQPRFTQRRRGRKSSHCTHQKLRAKNFVGHMPGRGAGAACPCTAPAGRPQAALPG